MLCVGPVILKTVTIVTDSIAEVNGLVFIYGWRWDHPKLLIRFRASLRMIVSAVDTQTAVPVSTAEVWILAPDI